MIYLLTPLCFLIDQYTKEKALKILGKQGRLERLNGKLKFEIVYNEGAFLGFLKKHKKLLLLINILAVIILVIFIIAMTVGKGVTLFKLGAAIIYGGAAGNIFDRIKRKKVIDFFAIEMIPNVYFNIADLFVFIGGALMMIGHLMNQYE